MSQSIEATAEAIPRADLLAQIATALNDPTAISDALFRLAEQATEAEAAASLVATDARRRSLDPALHVDDVAEALQAANAAAHDAARLSAARDLLYEKASARSDTEEVARKIAQYAHAEAERDRVLKRLKSEFPTLQARQVEPLSDLMAVNEIVDRANQNRPANAQPLQRPEGIARGFHDKDNLSHGGAPYNFKITRLVQMTVPDFSNPAKLAWPPALNFSRLDQMRAVQPSYPLVKSGWLAGKAG